MPLLYHWRDVNYRSDLGGGIAWHLNQKSARLHAIDPGDSLWAFTRDREKRYVLAAELVVRAKTFNPPGYAYGPHRVWAEPARSRFFRVEGQRAIEPVIRALSLRPEATTLGQAFQGPGAVRSITQADHAMFVAASEGLTLEPRAALPDEAALENALVAASRDHLHVLLPAGPLANRWVRLAQGFDRSRALVAQLRGLYSGQCQVCEWSPKATYGAEVCEGHHWHWLSRGGADDLGNLVLLCPNHHRAVHGCDAVLDFEGDRPVFDFGGGNREVVRLDRHRLAG